MKFVEFVQACNAFQLGVISRQGLNKSGRHLTCSWVKIGGKSFFLSRAIIDGKWQWVAGKEMIKPQAKPQPKQTAIPNIVATA